MPAILLQRGAILVSDTTRGSGLRAATAAVLSTAAAVAARRPLPQAVAEHGRALADELEAAGREREAAKVRLACEHLALKLGSGA